MRLVLASIIYSLLFSVILSAKAEGLYVSPVLLEAPPSGGAISFQIGSDKSRPVTVQIRVFSWSQSEGENLLVEADNVRFSPETFELAPQTTQTIRLFVKDTKGKGAWRVYIDELPTPDQAESDQDDGLQMRVRYILSMFAGQIADGNSLNFKIIDAEGGKKLQIENTSDGYARLHTVQFRGIDNTDTILRPQLIYVLPQATIASTIVSTPDMPTEVSFQLGDQEFTAELAQ